MPVMSFRTKVKSKMSATLCWSPPARVDASCPRGGLCGGSKSGRFDECVCYSFPRGASPPIRDVTHRPPNPSSPATLEKRPALALVYPEGDHNPARSLPFAPNQPGESSLSAPLLSNGSEKSSISETVVAGGHVDAETFRRILLGTGCPRLDIGFRCSGTPCYGLCRPRFRPGAPRSRRNSTKVLLRPRLFPPHHPVPWPRHGLVRAQHLRFSHQCGMSRRKHVVLSQERRLSCGCPP